MALIITGCINKKEEPKTQEKIAFLNKAILTSYAKADKEYVLILGNYDDTRTRDLIELSKKIPSKLPISYFDTSVYTAKLEDKDAKIRLANLKDYQAFLHEYDIKSLPTVIQVKKGKAIRQLDKLAPEITDTKKQKQLIKDKYQEWLEHEK